MSRRGVWLMMAVVILLLGAALTRTLLDRANVAVRIQEGRIWFVQTRLRRDYSRIVPGGDLDFSVFLEFLRAATDSRGVLGMERLVVPLNGDRHHNPPFDALGIPLAYLSIVPVGCGAWVLARWRRQRRRERLGLCLTCGYDLRESRGRCPECGSEAVAQEPAGRLE
jgi:hypothetical protein